MKFTVNQKQFAANLSIIKNAVPVKTALPILSSVLLSVEGQVLTMSATDLQSAITLKMPATACTDGDIAIPYKLLAKWAANTVGDVIVETGKKSTVMLTNGLDHSTISSSDAAEFPRIPSGDDSKFWLRMPAKALRAGINATVHAASKDDSRPALTCVMFDYEPNTLSLVATDGYRMATREIAIKNEHDHKALSPATTMKTLASVLAYAKDDVAIAAGSNYSAFGFIANESAPFAECRLIAMVQDMKFPAIEGIVPKKVNTKAVVNRQDLLRSVKLATVFASREMLHVELSVMTAHDIGMIGIKANDPEVGSHQGIASAQVEGPDLLIGMSGKFMIEALSSMTAKEVTLEFSSATRPMTICETGHINIIMPQMLDKLPR